MPIRRPVNTPVNTSVIIVSYNNWETTTRDCLDSLVADRANRGAEIIVVDNNSGDQTPELLKKAAREHPNIVPVLNSGNRGFAGGNNDGVNQAAGDILILLNSDTIVPEGAIGKLSSLLRSRPDWDLLGPVTNEAGNEQKIAIRSQDPGRIMAEGEQWARYAAEGEAFESRRLDFCCVAVRKEAYWALGGLDEGFGLGYYEDTDFSLKALAQGRKMMSTEQVFIYHKAGRSFSGRGRREVAGLMRRNKRLLKKKHGPRVELRHIRDCNLDVMAGYLSLMDGHPADSDYCRGLNARFKARMEMAEGFRPNSPLKKLIYGRKLKRLQGRFGRVDG